MLSGISHDLRTPLTRLKLQLAMVNNKEISDNMTKDIDTKKTDNTLPEELIPILQQILEQVEQGSDAPSLATEYEHLLLQRYIHYSAHYNAIETMVAGLPAKLQGFHPNAPAPSGERLVYPQTEGD